MWINRIQEQSIDYEVNEDLEWLMNLSDDVECVIQCLKDEISRYLQDKSEEWYFPNQWFIEQVQHIKDLYEVENHRIKDKIVWLQRRFNLWMK